MRTHLWSAAIMLAALAAAGALWAMHAHEVGQAFRGVPLEAFAAAVALHVATLTLRSETWLVTLDAAHNEAVPRRAIHAANAAAFVAGSFQSHAALPTRVALLRRLAGQRAPRPGVIVLADVPIVALELCATALLLVTAVVAGGGAWWIAPLSAALAAGVLTAARMAPARFARRPTVRGLAVLADRRRRRALAALVAGIVTLTLTRVWLALAVCGLPHGYVEIVTVYAALGAFGLLPIGPGVAPGATLAALGAVTAGASIAAGLMLGATSIVAVLAYALLVAAHSRLATARRRRTRVIPLPAGP